MRVVCTTLGWAPGPEQAPHTGNNDMGANYSRKSSETFFHSCSCQVRHLWTDDSLKDRFTLNPAKIRDGERAAGINSLCWTRARAWALLPPSFPSLSML